MTLFEANKSNLIVRYTELFTSGSAKVYYAEFSFSADWNGFAKVATFRNGSVSKSVAVDETNIFGIPWEVFATPGTLECGITGTKEDGTTLPTIWATVAPIKQGAQIGDEAKEVTPDIYEQLISRLDKGVTQAQNAAERAEAAAIHQPYPNSVTGTWWVWNTESGEYADSGISSAAYTLPPMTGTALGGAMADPAQEGDTQPVRIGADHKLYTAPGGGASGAVSSVNGKTGAVQLSASDVGAIPSPATAVVGQTIIVKAVNANGVPTEWEAADLPSGGGGLSAFEKIGTIDLSTMAASSVGVEYTVTDVTEVVLVWSGMTNTTTNYSSLILRFNDDTYMYNTLGPRTGKAGTPINGYTYLKVLEGVGVLPIVGKGATTNTNYTAGGAESPYNLIPVKEKIQILKIGQPATQYYADAGIVEVYVR